MPRQHYNEQTQKDCIDRIFRLSFSDPPMHLDHVFSHVSSFSGVSKSTLRRWYDSYNEWGEYPYETKKRRQENKRSINPEIEMERERYRSELRSMVINVVDVPGVIVIGKKMISLKEGSKCTMLAAFNIDGFVESTTLLQPERVDREMIIDWVERFLCPVLGSCINRERNSIVIMNNASVNMCQEVDDLIRSKAAIGA